MITDTKPAKLVSYLLLRNGSRVFLVKYKDSTNPKRNGWWIPAPELEYGEHPDDCAKRIGKSLGIQDLVLKFHSVDSFVTRDWHVLFFYLADVKAALKPDARYESGEWFDLDHLPAGNEFAHGQWELDLIVRLAEKRA